MAVYHTSTPRKVTPESWQNTRPVHREGSGIEDVLEDGENNPYGQGMRVMYTCRWNVIAIYCRGKGCYDGNKGEDAQNGANG